MTPEQKRLAIAEFEGWTKLAELWFLNRMWITEGPPYYLDDRNAMIAAVLKLSKAQQSEFGERLAEALGYDEDYYAGWNISTISFTEALTAPLDVVADCLLKTIGKFYD